MCGIAGIFTYGDPAAQIDREELLAIRDAMTHRGPDGAGLWLSEDGRVGLAHRRLAIIDLSPAGAQPMSSADKRLHVVFNGEIYNYRTLRAELEGRGHVFRSQSDTEVLLHLYAERGEEMVHALRGMYAFAIWDAQGGSLFLARDPFGIKPLYYADDGKCLRFASQVKALLRSRRVDTAASPAGHVGFFLWGSVPEPHTLYRGIQALPAGSTLRVGEAVTPRPKRFFSIAKVFAEAEETGGASSPVELAEKLGNALRDSVRHHLIADVPVGVFLSAGLDSTLVAGLATEVANAPLNTITLGFREYIGTENDETPLAETVAKRLGSIHRTRWVTRDDFEAEVVRLLASMDQPTIDGVNTYFVSKAAAEAGLKVALSGLGGDELFAAYPSFRDIPRMVRLFAPFRFLPRLGRGFRLLAAPLVRRFTSPKYAGLLEYGGTFAGAYLLRRGLYMPWELPEIMDPDLVRAGWRELAPLLALEETTTGLRAARFKISALELSWYMRNQLLRDADWAGMAHSLEIRVPLVDVRLLKTVATLVRANPGLHKHDAVGAARASLPDAVMRRSKSGFSVPVHRWLAKRMGQGQIPRGLRVWAQEVYCFAVAAR
ncbi:MAG: asparagine synthase (glutamine-hydrolyzing) [Rhodocyclaceae bacterium]|jgi:asparagine synthase (glutamine-hydrolysing)|nr:asparagine synthase (glutamine-hydrolyzing) [Rhodocyclaceae bacterium]